MSARAVVASRAAVIDRPRLPVLHRVPAPAATKVPWAAAGSGAPEVPNDAWRMLVVCDLWLRIGLIGGLSVGAALATLVDGEAAALPALGVAILGAALAVFAWRRGRSVLER